jgi:hypothetical protein
MLGLLRNDRFRQQFREGDQRITLRLPFGSWQGRRALVLTQILREATVGLESSVSSAVFALALRSGLMDDKILSAVKNPNRLGGNVAGSVYNGLPKLIDSGFTLIRRNAPLWKKTAKFYDQIRNPLFHSYELQSSDPDPVLACLEIIWSVYQWLNGWFPPEYLLEGPIQWSPEFARSIAEIPIVTDDQLASFLPFLRFPRSGAVDLAIEDVLGMYIGTDPEVQITARTTDGATKTLVVSSVAAMRLLGAMALAHQKRGWPIPDPLFG